MSTFKFSCPHCGQHLSGDAAWAGQQIQCPSCQKTITIPQAGATPAAASPPPLTVAAPPPAPPPVPPTPTTTPRQSVSRGGVSGLAIGALVLGLMTPGLNIFTSATQTYIPFFLITALPAIVLGHKAVEDTIRNGRRGKWLARIGMFFGYAAVLGGIVGYSFIGYHRFVKNERWDKFNRRWVPAEQAASKGTSSSTPSSKSPVFTERKSPSQTPSATTPSPVTAKPADPKVTTDPAKVEIPDKPVTGTVLGEPFRYDGSIYNSVLRTLDFRQGRGATPEVAVTLYLFTKTGETLEGKTMMFPNDEMRSVHVHVKRVGATPPAMTAVQNYSMRLEFGKRANGRLPGKIYLELPESAGTKIEGTFDAYIR